MSFYGLTMQYIKIVNWQKYQHYKNRRPPWIKLYSKLLRKYEFICLQDDSKLLLIFLWLLASTIEEDNPLIPSDILYLKQQLPFKGKIDLQPLVNAGFIEMVADCKQNDSNLPQTEAPYARARIETETEKNNIYIKSENGKTKSIPQYTLPDVLGAAVLVGIPDKEAEKFYHHYHRQGWLLGNGMPIENLSSALVCWRNSGYKFDSKSQITGNGKSLAKPKPVEVPEECIIDHKPTKVFQRTKQGIQIFLCEECRKALNSTGIKYWANRNIMALEKTILEAKAKLGRTEHE